MIFTCHTPSKFTKKLPLNFTAIICAYKNTTTTIYEYTQVHYKLVNKFLYGNFLLTPTP